MTDSFITILMDLLNGFFIDFLICTFIDILIAPSTF